MLKPIEVEVLSQVRDALATAPRGRKAAIVSDAASALGCSMQTVYRKLEDVGFGTQRKRRSDAGDSVVTDDHLRLISGVLFASINNKGQYMPLADALAMLQASGQIGVEVSAATVGRQLHARRMHPEQLALATPSVQMRSLHPNHVWQVDSTTGAYYYLPGGRLRWMPEDEFYKNKVHNLVKASTDLLTRYAAADHTSHAFKVRYYLGGETAANLLDFITWAMWKQDDSPMHGVPFILMMDPGAANKGQLMRNFAQRVGVQLIHHAPGAARVTGSVEKAHDLVRMHFESRLRFVDPREVSLDWLNLLIARWAASYCTTARHMRHGMSRYGKWMEIRAEQLRVPASLQVLRDAAVREPETRRVSNTKTITFGSRDRVYELDRVPGVVAGLKVMVVENPFRAPAIDVLFTCPDTGAETWHVVEPVKTDEHGYREGAPVIGQEVRSAAYSDVDHARSDAMREAYRTGDGLPTLADAAKARKAHAQAYAGVVDAMADVNATQVPTYMPRRTTPLALPERRVELQRMSVTAACVALRRSLGPVFSPQIRRDLEVEFPEGVPEDQLGMLLDRYRSDAEIQPIRATGGAA